MRRSLDRACRRLTRSAGAPSIHADRETTGGTSVLALRLYRTVPKRLRVRLLTALPPARQLWLARRLSRLSRRSCHARGRGWNQRLIGNRWAGVQVAHTTTPLATHERNLELVRRALDAAGVPYFCLPRESMRSALAVPLACQPAVLRLLREDPGLRDARVERAVVRAGPPGTRRGRLGPQLVVRVWSPVTDPARRWVLGKQYACEIEFWRRQGDRLVGPRPGGIAGVAPATDQPVLAPAWQLTPYHPVTPDAPLRPTRSVYARPSVEHVRFPIDVVYTWVDGSDPHWQQRKALALGTCRHDQFNHLSANLARYTDHDELRYSMRSTVYFAPWVRHIYLVTDDQAPPWLDLAHPMVTVVRHREIFGGVGRLPTFNSHAIESRLHHIPGLAEHFIYFNDDMFLGRPVQAKTFFHANGKPKFFLSPARIDPAPPSVQDAPVTAAAKNNRRIIADRFGCAITRKLRHVPYPLLRSCLEEIEATVPDEVRRTAEHQFRHPGDLSIASSLGQYWAFLSGRAVPGTVKYMYGDLAHPSTPVKLAQLLARRNYDVFCLNDTDSDESVVAQQHAMLADFLSAYFPFRAPFELPAEQAAERATLTATERMTRPRQPAPPPREPELAPTTLEA